MKSRPCLVCGGSDFLPYYKGLIKCESCDFVTADLDIEGLDLSTIYGKDYFAGNEYVDYIQDKESLQDNFRERLKSILKYKDSGYLIDVGCAYGFFLDLAKEFFQVKGYEICQDAVDFARRMSLAVECRDFPEEDIPHDSVDVITLWDVIEHLAEPQRYVVQANRVLRHNGLLCITTGDLGSLNARLRKEKWRMIHLPTHLHYFSKETLRMLLENNGFRIVREEYVPMTRSVRQIAYSILMLGKRKHASLFVLLERSGIARLKFTLNLRDILFVIAEKI